ncbi:MAG: hypothetical protein JO327_09340 [Nitrososphaeraceae archaeon]|nr:hypothetical protein [Nitrososphaeraceae archaeon]
MVFLTTIFDTSKGTPKDQHIELQTKVDSITRYLGLSISLSEKKKNDESSKVNDPYTHFTYLSEMIDKSSKRRQ